MQSDAPLDLTSLTQIQTILTAVQTTIQQAVTAGTFDTSDVAQNVDSSVLAVRLGWLCVGCARKQAGGRGAGPLVSAGTCAGCVLFVGRGYQLT